MTTGAPPNTDALTITRDYLEPAVTRAVESLRLPSGAWVLDAGTGAGGALPALAQAIGAAGSVRGVDLDLVAVPLARTHAARHRMTSRVTVERADVLDVALTAATEQGFDVIWAGDLVTPEHFVDPGAAVVALAAALQPGGLLALFYANHHQAVFLPGHARIERLARAAAEQQAGTPPHGRHHPDRHLWWLREAGLERTTLEAFPRVAFRSDVDRAARAHLESSVWPRMQAAVRACGEAVGMRTADVDELLTLTTPGDPRYVLDEPGWFALHPTVLVTGRRGRSGRR